MKTILVVDDQARIRRIYSDVFTKEGYRVVEAGNAAEADNIVETDHVDLMLLDIKMPEVDGVVLYDVAKMFRRDLKVIVASVYPLDNQKNLIKGATDYFDKSEGIKVLKEKVKEAMNDGDYSDTAQAGPYHR